MELVLALAILPLGIAALVAVLTGRPLRLEITHKQDVPPVTVSETPEEPEAQVVRETVAKTIQQMWMGVNDDDDSSTAG